MKKLDFIIQSQRIKQAEKYIGNGSLLDIGCHNGELFDHLLKKKLIQGDGIDPVLVKKITSKYYTLFPGYFPDDFKPVRRYDAITLLAVLEHIPIENIQAYPEIFSNYLKPGGRVIVTIPSRKVDFILKILLFFKLIKGMDLKHHQDYERALIKDIFIKGGYGILAEKKFELGLNLLYVFEKNS